MRRQHHLLSTVLLVILASSLSAQGSGGSNSTRQQRKPYVILISFDGMKPEYLDRIELPNFQRVIRAGVRSVGMIPTFPTKTFPNHYAIVTGWHAGRHGLVGNSFWDPARNAGYRISDTLAVRDPSWYRGEPIWVTAEKQGMVAASFFWPGSDAAIGGTPPTFAKKYDGKVPNFDRVDSVLAWLRLPPQNRPHMITMYFSDTDGAGHEHGPLSPQLDTAAWAVDSALGRLLDGIDRLEIRKLVYLVLVSDHGMSEQSPRWHVALDTLIDTAGVFIVEPGPNVNLHVRGTARARMLRDSINRRMRHGRAYLRGEIPARFHYNSDPRVGDVVVIMDEHFTIGRSANAPREGTATHGWDSQLRSMHAIFVASGPGIPAGRTIPSFQNVEIYPWLAELLGLSAAKGTDGRLGRLGNLIRDR
jgi:predicted AlkP superfamily pyrophosphatase or phosphodiesterase